MLQLVQAVWMAHVARDLGRFDVPPDLDDCRERPKRFITKINLIPLLREGRATLLGAAPIPAGAWTGRTIGRDVGRDGLPGPWKVEEAGVWRPYRPDQDDRRTMPSNVILLKADDIVDQLRLSRQWALDDWEVREALHAQGDGPEPTPFRHFVGRLRLSFAERRQADQARTTAEAAGWRVERRGAADRGWLLLLDRPDGSVPSDSDAALAALAAVHDGEFLGLEPHP